MFYHISIQSVYVLNTCKNKQYFFHSTKTYLFQVHILVAMEQQPVDNAGAVGRGGRGSPVHVNPGRQGKLADGGLQRREDILGRLRIQHGYELHQPR